MSLPPRHRRRIVHPDHHPQHGWDPDHDQRVEPHHDLVPEMPDPDWHHVLIHPDQKKMPVGDPTLWGNTVTTQIDNDPILTNTPRVIQGDQIVLAQASDHYTRSWSLTGVLGLPGSVWVIDGATVQNPFFAAVGLNVYLTVTLGIDKITIVHQILLCSNGGATNIGLCNNQSSVNGGPYVPGYVVFPPNEASYQYRPFAAIGALVGNTINVRGTFVRGGPVPPPGFDFAIPSAVLSCMITPYAPGSGI